MHSTRTLVSALALSLATCASLSTSAAILANYAFPSGSAASSDADATSTASSFVANGNAGISSSTATAFLRGSDTGSDQAAALSDSDFFSFTLSVNDAVNERLDLTSLVFDFGGTNQSGSTYTSTVFIQSSVGGTGASGPVLFSDSFNVPVTTTVLLDTNNTVDLTDAAFNDLTTITFNIRFADSSSSSNAINRLDNVVVNGQVVPIPEPSSLALLGLGGLLMVHRRRKTSAGRAG